MLHHVMGYGLSLVSPVTKTLITLPGPGIRSYLDKGYTFYRSTSMEQAGGFILTDEYHLEDKNALVALAHLYLKASLLQSSQGNTQTLPASLAFLFSEDPLVPNVDYARASELGVPLSMLMMNHVEELRFWTKITACGSDFDNIRFKVSGGLYTGKDNLYTVSEAGPSYLYRIPKEEWEYSKLENLVMDIHRTFYETMEEIVTYWQGESTTDITVSLLQYLELMDLYIDIVHTYTKNFKG